MLRKYRKLNQGFCQESLKFTVNSVESQASCIVSEALEIDSRYEEEGEVSKAGRNFLLCHDESDFDVARENKCSISAIEVRCSLLALRVRMIGCSPSALRIQSTLSRMFPGKKQPDFAKKAALEKEVVDVLETYGKRLRAVRRTMDDIKKKKNELRESAEVEVTLIRQMDDLRCENENALGRLRENIGIAAKSADPNTDVLGSVWNITRMKVIYHPVLKGAFESSSICNGWKRRPSVLEAMEKHNQEIFVSRVPGVVTRGFK